MSGLRDRDASPPHARKWEGYERHAAPGWYEWSLREPLRYCYGLGVLMAAILVPLQMSDSWLPFDAPPVLPAAAVGGLALAFLIGLAVLAAYVYRYVWGKDGWVDRAVERHLHPGLAAARADDDKRA